MGGWVGGWVNEWVVLYMMMVTVGTRTREGQVVHGVSHLLYEAWRMY